MAALKSLIVPAVAKHTATVIFIHGLGDTGHGWEFLADTANSDSALHHVKWVLPHAPITPVTANMGMRMPSWFDIRAFGSSFGSREDEEGMLDTVKSLEGLIKAEVDAGVDPSRVVLGGFSQGAAMTLLTGLSTPTKLGGLIVMSGWLPLKDKIKSRLSSHASSYPIFWGHGESDPLVRFEWATKSKEILTGDFGFPVATKDDVKGLNFNSYRGLEHSASPKELEDALSWLKQVVPAVYIYIGSAVLFWYIMELCSVEE